MPAQWSASSTVTLRYRTDAELDDEEYAIDDQKDDHPVALGHRHCQRAEESGSNDGQVEGSGPVQHSARLRFDEIMMQGVEYFGRAEGRPEFDGWNGAMQR
jgi:hypothetical protein